MQDTQLTVYMQGIQLTVHLQDHQLTLYMKNNQQIAYMRDHQLISYKKDHQLISYKQDQQQSDFPSAGLSSEFHQLDVVRLLEELLQMFVPVSQDWSLRFTWSQKNRVDVSILFALSDQSSSWDVQMMSRIVHLLDVSLHFL